VPLAVTYKGETVGDYFADLIVNDRVVIELKAQDQVQKAHEAQILNYLRATGKKVGLLVNFAYPKATVKRFVF
jgi:GxxExxY protein